GHLRRLRPSRKSGGERHRDLRGTYRIRNQLIRANDYTERGGRWWTAGGDTREGELPNQNDLARGRDRRARSGGGNYLRDQRLRKRHRIDVGGKHGQRRRTDHVVGLDQHDAGDVGDRKDVVGLEKNRPEFRQLFERKMDRREAHQLLLIGKVGAVEESHAGLRVLDVCALQDRVCANCASGGAQQPLLFKRVVVAVEGQQVVEVERHLRPSQQRAVGRAS